MAWQIKSGSQDAHVRTRSSGFSVGRVGLVRMGGGGVGDFCVSL